jgi:ACS family hexuronate transporter-like MFS transporter
MTGLSGFAGALGGAVSASFVGMILQSTGSYFLIFCIASIVYLINWIILKIFLKEIKPIEFNITGHSLSANKLL